ncbi:MAG: GNAT family N-acetyltransferase [Maribacter sp.]|uniref:GNAT family N-acetyltransferase n=1 Tax=Maribacter sp. TaxID=1897614 RepID=UPI003297BCD8
MIIKSITAKETWPLRHAVMWPQMPFDFVKLPEDPDGYHFGLFIDKELVSVVSLFQTADGIAQFRKFATLANRQGKGYGAKLLSHLIEFAQKQGFRALWCNARADKIAFYKKFGMGETQEFFTKENVKFAILKKVL